MLGYSVYDLLIFVIVVYVGSTILAAIIIAIAYVYLNQGSRE